MNPADTHLRTAAFLLVAACMLFSPGCFRKKTYTPPPPPGTIDLAKVTPVGAADAADAATRVCRHFDTLYRGNDQPRILTLNHSAIVDDNGIGVPITPEEFKGIVNLVEANQDKEITSTARLARTHNYKDARGLAQRHVYLFDSPDGVTELRVIATKRAESESDG